MSVDRNEQEWSKESARVHASERERVREKERETARAREQERCVLCTLALQEKRKGMSAPARSRKGK